jgi:formylglycine-generating enzyme required for sulfatase activity
MVWVEGGSFTMGATAERDGEVYNDEKPAHRETFPLAFIHFL